MRWTVGTLLLAVLVAGCAMGYTLVEPRRTAVGDVYTVEPQIPWSAAKAGKRELWTVDGPGLQAIRFVNGLVDGEALFEGGGKEKRPTFRKTMAATELREFVVDSLAQAGLEKIETTGLRPEPFGGAQGFRFDMSFVLRQGLEGQGTVAGAVLKEKLYLIIYSGARAHYYPKHKEHVERIIQSIRTQ
jgi:hypothetical protein